VTVVMPRSAPRIKATRCHALGAHVILHGATFEEAEQQARSLAATHGFAFVHPFNDAHVIAGQGTLALEVLFAEPDIDAIVLPVGGGGLLAGVATVVKALRPEVQVIAVEPAPDDRRRPRRRTGGQPDLGNGPALGRSLRHGERGRDRVRPACSCRGARGVD
jgi:threonine dehydratase